MKMIMLTSELMMKTVVFVCGNRWTVDSGSRSAMDDGNGVMKG